jgi:transcriptional repressor NrdR
MICPFCKEKETSVIDSRPTEDGTVIRRRRECSCKQRFTTFERVQLRERPVDSDTIEKFISKIYRNLEDLGQAEILSSTIGKYVMEGLKELDPVAYVRFASVYTNFKEAKDFEQFVDQLNVPSKK